MRLVAIEPQLVACLATSVEELERAYELRVGEVAALVRDTVGTGDLAARAPRRPPFGGYLAVDEATRLVVGTCAFKAPPGADGEVEIAYDTFAPFEGRGHATSMARALTLLALSWPGVRKVIAHTLPRESASTSVLRKAGLHHIGEVEDPEDGRVWRWEITDGGDPEVTVKRG